MLNLSLKTRFLFFIATLACLLTASLANAQDARLIGEWRGTFNINIGGDRELVFTITQDGEALKAIFDSPTQGMYAISAESVMVNGNNIQILLPRIDGIYSGSILKDMGSDGQPARIDGDWSQAGEFIPILLTRKIAD